MLKSIQQTWKRDYNTPLPTIRRIVQQYIGRVLITYLHIGKLNCY